MTTQSAIVVQEPGRASLAHNVPIPDLSDDYILIKTKAVFQKGDRVAGFVHGSNAVRLNGGAFAEYVIAKGDLQILIPDSMSFEAAATFGVGLTTVGQNLYQSMELPFPGDPPGETDDTSILIYGGATATGTLAIQLAKLSGLRVATTCSESNRSFMFELGADAVFDYHDPQVGDQIREDTDDALELVLDTISTPQSAAICSAAISSAGGSYNALLDVQCPREDVDSHVSMAYDLLGEPYRMGAQETSPDNTNFEFGAKWWELAQQLLHDRRIHPHPYQVKPGGLAGALAGLQTLREGKVRACKLVYRVDEVE
ncbi:Polyketide synthase enoylreductase [Penicillium paradoxum]|uniref:Polyketide synthase enoylreductase n=1 Tax=Penicillium paradoxum TaxID=176176 RepID=UPI002547487A|nr:Polyketide synthase enoylreductase [Penicillium paradoxum]KAJ5794144.1 Polyketide synthase enoylreductase [Penicillium paradoxum]